MPNTDVTEIGQAKLREQYALIQQNWPSLELKSAPPSFEQWRGINTLLAQSDLPLSDTQDEIRLFNTVEWLVTHMGMHSFTFTHLDLDGRRSEDSSRELATLLVQEFKLSESYAKRIQALFDYYAKSAMETADLAKIRYTTGAKENLADAFNRLKARTADAFYEDDLAFERAMGRIEGAGALLVRIHMMSREKITQETEEFKNLLRTGRKKLPGKATQP